MLSLVSILWVFFSFFGALGLFENKTVGGCLSFIGFMVFFFLSEFVPKGMRFLGCLIPHPSFLSLGWKIWKTKTTSNANTGKAWEEIELMIKIQAYCFT